MHACIIQYNAMYRRNTRYDMVQTYWLHINRSVYCEAPPIGGEGSHDVTGATADCMGGFSLRLLVSATTESNAIQKTRQGHCIFLIRSKPRVSHCLVPGSVRSRSILDSVGAQRSDYKGIIDWNSHSQRVRESHNQTDRTVEDIYQHSACHILNIYI